MQWCGGGVLAEVEAHAVAPLFDALLDHSIDGYAVALDLLSMYVFRRWDTLENFRSQLRKIAENFTKYSHLLPQSDERTPLWRSHEVGVGERP